MKIKSFNTLKAFCLLLFLTGNIVAYSQLVTVRFSWPLRLKAGVSYPGYYAISKYVDHDTSSAVLDYNGGDQTYDGHDGTDIRIWPYSWNKVQESEVEVIAAADGKIISKKDGYEHDHCSWSEGDDANMIKIRHAQGIVTIYAHMKKNSLTSKAVGDSVKRGEFLGIVASSGTSSTPHLHFEVEDGYGNTIDPWKGPKNSTISYSLWQSQLPYLPSGVNQLVLSYKKTESTSPNCPDLENTYERLEFFPGNTIFFNVMTRHELKGHVINYKVYKPDNTVWKSWSSTATDDNTVYRHTEDYTLPYGAPVGTWKFEVVYLNKTYTKTFKVTLIDCFGDIYGSAYYDDCGNCVGGYTGKKTSDIDQDGVSDCRDACPFDPEKQNAGQGSCACVPFIGCRDVCTTIPVFSRDELYTPGETTKYNGKIFKSRIATMLRTPDFDPYGPWEYIGNCTSNLPPLTWFFKASPNPAKDELTLTFNEIKGPVSITVYNFMGQELCSFPPTEYGENFTFPIEKLPSGFLLVKVVGEDFSETLQVKKE